MSDQPDNQTDSNRRLGDDRRLRPTPLLSKFSLVGRRFQIRRDTDFLRGRYVDRSNGIHLAVILTLLIFIALDAASTLYILSHGGTEVNPFMDRALRKGVGWFLLIKLGPLPIAFFLLSVHRYFNWVRFLMYGLTGIYGALMCYHLFLLFRIHQ